MERLKCNLTFRELRKDENLYDDVDLTARSMVDAQYRRVAGYEDNPDVCALPKMPSVRDILALGMVNPPGYNREQVEKMSTAEKLAAIEDIDMAMIPLGIHVDVARTIWKFLDRRYKGADVMISANEDEKAYGMGKEALDVLSFCIRSWRPQARLDFCFMGRPDAERLWL